MPGEARMGPKGSATSDAWGSFARAFEMAQVQITARARIGASWPLFELFKDKNEENCRVIRQWLDPLVKLALDDKEKRLKTGVSTPVGERTFLEHLAESVDSEYFHGHSYRAHQFLTVRFQTPQSFEISF